MDTASHDRLLRIEEAADILAVSRRQMYRLLEDGLLRPVRLRGSVRLRLSDIEALIEGAA